MTTKSAGKYRVSRGGQQNSQQYIAPRVFQSTDNATKTKGQKTHVLFILISYQTIPEKNLNGSINSSPSIPSWTVRHVRICGAVYTIAWELTFQIINKYLWGDFWRVSRTYRLVLCGWKVLFLCKPNSNYLHETFKLSHFLSILKCKKYF